MVTIRRAIAYRRLERPNTRISKYKNRAYVKGRPHSQIVRFDMGDPNKDFDCILDLKSTMDIQLRHNCIESGRQSANRVLELNLGKAGYFFKIMIYPHHILRENPLASGAGADRMSTGMQKSFGKTISVAARVKKGQTILQVKVFKQNLLLARKALRRFTSKIACPTLIVVTEKSKKAKAE